jgi:hypothetical protein
MVCCSRKSTATRNSGKTFLGFMSMPASDLSARARAGQIAAGDRSKRLQQRHHDRKAGDYLSGALFSIKIAESYRRILVTA